MAAYNAGSAAIELFPSFKGFATLVDAEMAKIGAQAGDRWADAFNRSAQARLGSLNVGPGTTGAARQGAGQGGSFADAFKARVEAALRNLPSPSINLRTDADRKIADIRVQLRDLAGQKVGVDISSADAVAKLNELQARLKEIGSSSADPRIKVDSARAMAELGALQAELDRIDGRNVDIDTSGATRGVGNLLAGIVVLGPALIPLGAAAVAGIGAIGVAAGAAVGAVGVLALAFHGITDGVKNLGKLQQAQSNDAERAAAKATASAQAQESAQRSLASAQAGLANARASADAASVRSAEQVAKARAAVGRAEQDAAKAVADTEANLAQARTQSARATADAERNLVDARTSAVRSIADAERSLADARAQSARSISDAEKTVASTRDETTRQTADAVRRLAEVEASAAERVQSALQTQARAERTLADAQGQARRAQEDLNDARKSAQQQLEDLALQVQDAALAQRQGVLGVQRAKEDLDKTLADPKATELDRQQAQLSYDQAVQHLTDLGVRNQRLAVEQQAAAAAGVDGAAQVVAALARQNDAAQVVVDAQTAAGEAAAGVAKAQTDGAAAVALAQQNLAQVQVDAAARVADSQQKLTDAQQQGARRVSDAQRTLADAQASGAERVAKAQQALTDAQTSGAQRVLDAQQAAADAQTSGAERVAAAQQSVSDAVRGQAETQRQSAASIASAQRSVVDAFAGVRDAAKETGTVGQTETEKLRAKLAELSPAALGFVTFLREKMLPAFDGLQETAQANLFPGLTAGLQALLPVIPMLTPLVANLASALGGLFEDAGKGLSSPFFTTFFQFMQRTAGPIVEGFGRLFGDLVTIFAGLVQAFYPVAQVMGAGLLNLTERFAAFSTQTGPSSGIQQFVTYLLNVLPQVSAFFGSVFTAVGHLLEALAPVGAVILGSIKLLADAISAVPVDVLGAVLSGIIAVVAALKIWSIVQLVLNTILEANPIGLVVVAVIALVAAFIYAYKNSETFRDIVNGVFDSVKKTVGDFADFFTKTIPAAWDTVLKAFSDAYDYVSGFFAEHWALVLGIVTGPIGLAVTAIATHWSSITKAFGDGYDYVTGFFKKNWDLILAVVTGPVGLAAGQIIKHWGEITGAFSTALTYVSGAFNTGWALVSTLLSGPVSTAKTAIDTAWSGISGAFTTVKNWVVGAFKAEWDGLTALITNPIETAKNTVTTLLGAGKGGLQYVFQAAVSAIGRIWDGLKELAKAPIRFIVETVLNDGLIAAFNFVSSKIGGPHIGDVTLPKGFARGGWTGPGGKYQPAGIVHADEYVIRKESQQRLAREAPGFLDYLNTTGRLPGFAGGGLVGDLKEFFGNLNPLDFLRDKIRGSLGRLKDLGDSDFAKIVSEVPRKLAASLIDALSGVVGNLLPDIGGGSTPAPGQSGLLGPAGPGDFPSLIAYLQSTHLPFRVNSTTGGTHAAGSYHYQGRAVDFGPAGLSSGSAQGQAVMRQIFEAFLPIAGSLKELFFTPMGYSIKNGGRVAPIAAAGHYNHVHAAYDSGGYLPPGFSTVFNGTGKPEPVLTSAQFGALAGAAAGGGGVVTLAPEDRRLFERLADRPTLLHVGERVLAETVRDYSADRRDHGDPGWR